MIALPRTDRMDTENATNIGTPETEFVDRTEEIEQLRSRFADGERLVSLVGTAGAGKTRLARELGRRLVGGREGGVWFCGLADARRREDVVSTVAEVLDVSLDDLESFDERRDRVARALAGRGSTLLILDNVEQVTDAVRETIRAWYEATDEVAFLVTSRQRLHLGAEYCFDVEALPSEAAVDLFGERARRVQRNFEVDDANRDDVAELVGHLDGLPLAVELAAARVRTMTPAEMVERMASRFQLLRSSNRDSETRQATLEEAIDWSWSQLEAWERDLLVQCAVFRGGFSLEAAEAVCELDDEAPWMVDAVELLVDKSLIRTRGDSSARQSRFGMYESIRAFVLESEAADEATLEAVERRHAEYFADCVGDWAERADRADGAESRRRIRLERENLYAAFERFRGRDADLAFQLADLLAGVLAETGRGERRADVVEFLVEAAQGRSTEWRRRAYARRADLRKMRGDLEGAAEDLERAVGAADETGESEPRVELRLDLGDIARERGEPDRAVEVFERALELAESAGQDGHERAALAHLASCHADGDRLDEARDCVEEAEARQPLENVRRECRTHRRLAYVQYYLGNFERQRELQKRALEYARELESRQLEGECLQGLADAAFARSNYEEAVGLYEEALDVHRRSGNRHLEGILLGNLGAALHRSDRLDEAERRYREALRMHRETGAELYRVIVLHSLGVLVHERGDAEGAEEYYRRAIEAWNELEAPGDRAAVELCASWLAVERGEFDGALERLNGCVETFAEVGETRWRALGLATRALVHLIADRPDEGGEDRNAARELADDAEGLEAEMAELVVDWLETGGEVESPDELADSLYGRALVHTLDELGGQLDGSDETTEVADPDGSESADHRLVVGPEARWCRLDDGEVVDLRRRGAIRRVLEALVERRREAPGEGIEVYDLFEIGWPDDEAPAKQSADRVYWAIRTLRDLGFRDLLITSDEGYFLDPDLLVVERVDRAIPEE